MKPLIPQTVLIPYIYHEDGSVGAIEKQSQYIFTKEEITVLLQTAMDESVKMYTGFYDNLNMDEEELRQQFINNLLNQQ